MCVQSHCRALGSHPVQECQDWKGAVFRGHLSQILTPKVTDTSEPRRGRGSGRARTSPQDTGLLASISPSSAPPPVASRLSLCV